MFFFFFFSLFIFRGHWTREPASCKVTYFILRAYTGTGVSHSQHRKIIGRGFGQNASEWTGRVEVSKEEIPGSMRSMCEVVIHIQCNAGQVAIQTAKYWSYHRIGQQDAGQVTKKVQSLLSLLLSKTIIARKTLIFLSRIVAVLCSVSERVLVLTLLLTRTRKLE